MLDNLTNTLDFQSKALVLRADRQRVIASNIANADTPGYAARDFDFASALRDAGVDGVQGGPGGSPGSGATSLAMTRSASAPSGAGFMPLSGPADGETNLGYTVQTQPSADGNSVDLDRERAAFADNAVRYEATLRFINSQSKTMLSAIQGQ
jgi:flagellar basal-body rod protein FlgB